MALVDHGNRPAAAGRQTPFPLAKTGCGGRKATKRAANMVRRPAAAEEGIPIYQGR